jgi:hypothetical protein
MTDTVCTGVAARAYGAHYDTFRKNWRTYVVTEGFPAPVRAKAPYRWAPASLAAWQARREAENAADIRRAATAPDAPANENHHAAPAARRVDRERAAVMALMQGAQAGRLREPTDSRKEASR